MTRVNKFRAWDGKKMWQYAVPLLSKAHNGGTINVSDNEDGSFNQFINGELMQFTGLYDKDGKEIYDGDIIKFLLPVSELDHCSSSTIFGTEPQNSFNVCTKATYPIRGFAQIFISEYYWGTSLKKIKCKILDENNDEDVEDYYLADPNFQAGGADGIEFNINDFYYDVVDFQIDACIYNGDIFDAIINIEVIGNIYENPKLLEVQP